MNATRLLPMLLLGSANAFGAGTQCAPSERVIFSCALPRSKVVSVCLVKPTTTVEGSLTYRFGALNKPELVFPTSPTGSLQRFRYAHYFRFQVDRSELSFTNGGVEYAVYDYYEGDDGPRHDLRGVRVSVGGKDRDLSCTGGVVSRLPEVEKLVPCDKENALASCN